LAPSSTIGATEAIAYATDVKQMAELSN